MKDNWLGMCVVVEYGRCRICIPNTRQRSFLLLHCYIRYHKGHPRWNWNVLSFSLSLSLSFTLSLSLSFSKYTVYPCCWVIMGCAALLQGSDIVRCRVVKLAVVGWWHCWGCTCFSGESDFTAQGVVTYSGLAIRAEWAPGIPIMQIPPTDPIQWFHQK